MSDRPTTAPGVLAALRPRLTRGVREAGFVLADASPPGEVPKADIGFVEYRADLGGRRPLLDFYEDPSGRTVVAELWDPSARRRTGPRVRRMRSPSGAAQGAHAHLGERPRIGRP